MDTDSSENPRFLQEPEDLATENPTAPSFEFKVVTVNARGKIIHREQHSAEYRTENLGSGAMLDMVKIPGGSFTMGSPEDEEGRNWYGEVVDSLRGTNVEGPQHTVSLDAFFIGKYPVTQAQWKAIAALPRIQRNLTPDLANFKGDHRPVEQVSWNDANEFCQRLSKHTGRDYRLPSEAEWEYACRAGTITPFHFGPTITTGLANYAGIDGKYQEKILPGAYGQGPKGKYRQQTTKVGRFPANTFGLYDMHGNVWEWCADHWHETYDGAPDDGSAWLSSEDNNLRLLRGGSWGYRPWYCRSALRNWVARIFQSYYVGLRVVCASSWG
jgi:formylglycine-generating enzyme required for sulfatase activity